MKGKQRSEIDEENGKRFYAPIEPENKQAKLFTVLERKADTNYCR